MRLSDRLFVSMAACAGAAVLAVAVPAHAVPVAVKTSADYSASPYSFTIDDSTFTFSSTGDPFNPTAIQTAGGGQVNSFGGFLGIPVEPTSNFIDRGTVVFGPGTPFSAFPGAATIPFSNGDNFIGLLAVANGQDYYGFAYTTDTVLNGYAFETVPDTAITATAALPEPASWTMLIGGFAVIGGALRTRKRTVPGDVVSNAPRFAQ
jgi:hypothetical protein